MIHTNLKWYQCPISLHLSLVDVIISRLGVFDIEKMISSLGVFDMEKSQKHPYGRQF